jgi:hypothetical protein
MEYRLSPTTRKQLQESFPLETQRKNQERIKEIDRWIAESVYLPLQNAAKEGKTEFIWQIPAMFTYIIEEYEYAIRKIRHLFPDCDVCLHSIDDFRSLGSPKSRISWK